jgi:hypothetical protein
LEVAEVQELQRAGERVLLLDLRSEASHAAATQDVPGALRLHPDRAAPEARVAGLPSDAWLVTFCT